MARGTITREKEYIVVEVTEQLHLRSVWGDTSPQMQYYQQLETHQEGPVV